MREGITYNKAGDAVCFAGADAVAMYRAAVLKSAIGLMAKGIKPTRGASMRSLLASATEITGKAYARKDAVQAQADLSRWVQEMKAALPQETV